MERAAAEERRAPSPKSSAKPKNASPERSSRPSWTSSRLLKRNWTAEEVAERSEPDKESTEWRLTRPEMVGVSPWRNWSGPCTGVKTSSSIGKVGSGSSRKRMRSTRPSKKGMIGPKISSKKLDRLYGMAKTHMSRCRKSHPSRIASTAKSPQWSVNWRSTWSKNKRQKRRLWNVKKN